MEKREIKFRVWNGMEMIHDVTVGKFGTFYVNPELNKDGLNPSDRASLTQNTTKYPDNTPVMQFTGLLDKNGTEIYEGDILGWESYEGTNNQVRWVVEFSVQTGFKNWSSTKNDEIVLGNIYENPELTK